MAKILLSGTTEFNNYCFVYKQLAGIFDKDEDVLYIGTTCPLNDVLTTYAKMHEFNHVIVESVEDTLYTCDSLLVVWDNKTPHVAELLLKAKQHDLTTCKIHYQPEDMLVSTEMVVHCKQNPIHDIYIGRPSIWENKVKLIDEAHRIICISEYAHYLLSKPTLFNKLPELEGQILGCWCGNKPCHGWVLQYLLKTYGELISTDAITSFRGDNFFLSNFYPSIMSIDDMLFPTLEHAYQASKSNDLTYRNSIRISKTPMQAKHLGYKIKLRSDWDEVKLSIMEDLIDEKFKYGSTVANQLIATKRRMLVEGNNWNDVYWGICKGEGLNHLGKLLMKKRKQLIKQQRDERYINRLLIPIISDPTKDYKLFTKSGVKITDSYSRIVIGDKVPMLELDIFSDIHNHIKVPKEQRWRLKNDNCYYNWYETIEDKVKVYEQKKTVKYADYKIDMFYISVYDLYLEDGRCIIKEI